MNPRKLTYALLASLLLNAFLLGVFSMRALSKPDAMRGGLDKRGVAAEGPRLLREMVRAAGGPRDPRVRDALSGNRQKLPALRADIEAAQHKVFSAIEQEPLNRDALLTAVDEFSAARKRAEHVADSGLVDLALKLSAPERAEFCRKARSAHPGRGMRE